MTQTVLDQVDSAPAAGRSGPSVGPRPRARRRPGLHKLSIFVLICGLIVTGGLCAASRLNYLHSEQRQVNVQVQLTAAAVSSAPVDVQRRIGRPALLAAATEDLTLAAAEIGKSVPSTFVGARLFRMDNHTPSLVFSYGGTLQLPANSPQSTALLQKAETTAGLTVTRTATAKVQHLCFAFSSTIAGRTYVAYAESALPGDRHLTLPANSPLANLDFALYYGTKQTQQNLLETNVRHLPLHGTLGRAPVQFGDQVLTLVITPRSPLLGTFAFAVAWLILGAGILLTLVMTVLTERLIRRQAVTEQLATVSRQLYEVQHGVAETLQTSLLPQRLPQHPSLQVATRYIAGTEGINVGGDWYDVITLDEDRVFFTIGDVSGRGLSAATMMSRLRHTITAYAMEGHDPATVLTKLSGLIDLGRDEHFATVICGTIDLHSGLAQFANAGHPPLVLVSSSASNGTPIAVPVGPPVGVGRQYTVTTKALSRGDVLLAYTDGLIERRGESVEAGIRTLCLAARSAASLEELLDTVLGVMTPHGASDDTAILGLRWNP